MSLSEGKRKCCGQVARSESDPAADIRCAVAFNQDVSDHRTWGTLKCLEFFVFAPRYSALWLPVRGRGGRLLRVVTYRIS